MTTEIKSNPTLEEFSHERFNPLIKVETQVWKDMEAHFPNFSSPERTQENIDSAKKYIAEQVQKIFNNFKDKKDRLNFCLDYLWLHFYARTVVDIVTKPYRPESKKFAEMYPDFDARNEMPSFNQVFDFIAKEAKWLGKITATAQEIMKRRGIWGIDDKNYLGYFEATDNFDRNITRDATHFQGVFDLPEYFIMIPDKPEGKTPSTITIAKVPNKPLPDGRAAPNRNMFPLGKFNWDQFSFQIWSERGGDGVLMDFHILERFEQEIETRIKEMGEAVSEIEPTPAQEELALSSRLKGYMRKGQTLIEFADGSKWVFLDHDTYCKLEGQSMGHCGNDYRRSHPDLRIMSFRIPAPHAPGKWVGKLTFIYNKATKLIGESKARGNSKPPSSLHPYIIELLKLPMVEGLEQGSHRVENDFHFKDLNDEDLKKLIEDKPTLFIKSKVGRSVIINRNHQELLKEAYKKKTGEEAPNLDDLKFDND